jgi:succinate dehydrogenase / fumarate reductase cytochrome b subunit
MMKYAYYPGCSALRSAVELDAASRLVFQKLGLEWSTLEDAACCGSRECGGLGVEDASLKQALNARTLAQAERQGVTTMITVCSTCQLELMTDNLHFQQDPTLLAQVNRALAKIGLEYRGSVEVKHLLYVIIDDIGLEHIAELVTRPLHGLRIAPFYGCHLLRPGNTHGYRDDPYHPRSLGELIKMLGGKEVIYNGATKCCGFHALMVREKTALRMSGKHIQEAISKEAALMVTPCPLCHTVLDNYQPRAAQELGVPLNLPILHLPQLIGLALGLSPEELMLKRHVVPAESLLL